MFDEMLYQAISKPTNRVAAKPIEYKDFMGFVDSTIDNLIERDLREAYDRGEHTNPDSDKCGFLYASFFWTRTIPKRMAQEVVNVADHIKRKKELQSLYKEKKVWVFNLKEFTKFDRDQDQHSSQIERLRVQISETTCPHNCDNCIKVCDHCEQEDKSVTSDLVSFSEIFKSNAWRVPKVRLVVTENLRTAWEDLKVLQKLERWFGQPGASSQEGTPSHKARIPDA